ncbi:hypothetical protein BURK_019845 [Burkholderia sp. SJ98]|nr:hypothetical protein BURK_019845 [Burkholderia sp. SJ98]
MTALFEKTLRVKVTRRDSHETTDFFVEWHEFGVNNVSMQPSSAEACEYALTAKIELTHWDRLIH